MVFYDRGVHGTFHDFSFVDRRAAMNRERALKVVMVLVGLLFVAAIYPVEISLWHPSPSDDTGAK